MRVRKAYLFSIAVLLILTYTAFNFGGSGNLDVEYEVKNQIIEAFSLDVVDSTYSNPNALKPLFMRDVYDNEIAEENPDVRVRIAKAIDILFNDGEILKGDYKPIVFLEGNSRVFIGIKHSDNTMTLAEFDISTDAPIKLSNKVKG